jgi:carbon storage regulator
MLYLKRKKHQSIMIGQEIEIQVIDVSDSYVTLGFKSPGNMQVLRKEIYDKVTSQNIAALSSFIDVVTEPSNIQ